MHTNLNKHKHCHYLDYKQLRLLKHPGRTGAVGISIRQQSRSGSKVSKSKCFVCEGKLELKAVKSRRHSPCCRARSLTWFRSCYNIRTLSAIYLSFRVENGHFPLRCIIHARHVLSLLPFSHVPTRPGRPKSPELVLLNPQIEIDRWTDRQM